MEMKPARQAIDRLGNGTTLNIETQPDQRTKVSGKRVQGSDAIVQDHSTGYASAFGRENITGGCYRLEGTEPVLQRGCHVTVATFAKVMALLAALATVARLWGEGYDRSTQELCTPSSNYTCTTDRVSQALLTISRFAAGALFPSIGFCMVSKCYATRFFLNRSWIAFIVDFEPTHTLHTFFGWGILVCSVVHGAMHIARLVYEREYGTLYTRRMYLSGIVALFLLLLVTLPMMLAYLRAKWTYEIRKAAHFMFSPFLLALCFHGTALRVQSAVLLGWYTVDRLYFTTKLTYFIPRPKFKVVGTGTLVKFDLPSGYEIRPGSYVQVNCPAISASEWHPFSIFPVPTTGPLERAAIHVEAVGDWTQKMFRLSLEDPRMPLWISASQPSVMENTLYFDNVIIVCTGSGITPAVSVVNRFAKTKNIHLLWMSKEPGKIAMFEKQIREVKSTVCLTGSPTAETKQHMADLLSRSLQKTGSTMLPASTSTSTPPLYGGSPDDELPHTDKHGGTLILTTPTTGFQGVKRQKDIPEEKEEEEAPDLPWLWSDRHSAETEHVGLGTSEEGSCRPSSRARAAQVHVLRDRSASYRQSHFPSATRGSYSRGQFPVSFMFGRPNIEQYIGRVVQGKAGSAGWVGCDCDAGSAVSSMRYRLESKQQSSKRYLMSADLSVMEEGSAIGKETLKRHSKVPSVPASTEARQWLVIYCGANTKVEQAVIRTCAGLPVSYRQENFGAW